MILGCVLLTLKTGPGPSMKSAAENMQARYSGTGLSSRRPRGGGKTSGAQSHSQLQSEFEASLGYMTPSQKGRGHSSSQDPSSYVERDKVHYGEAA